VAASAAIARAAEIELELEAESDGDDPKPQKRSWAQVVSNSIKEEEVEESDVLYSVPQETSTPIKEEKINHGVTQTWAQVCVLSSSFSLL
jgi:hypothetical protein